MTATSTFERTALPSQFCNIDRLLASMAARNIDGIVAATAANVFYLSGFNGIAHKSDEPRPYAIVLSRQAPQEPIALVADYYLGTFATQPSWIQDIRPFRAVMMGLDLPPSRTDIERFVPEPARDCDWLSGSVAHYAFDLRSALEQALNDLGLDGKRVAIDDLGAGHRLLGDKVELVDGYDPFMFARAVKTAPELELLARATRLNQLAIERTVASWQEGVTWRELNRSYHQAVVDLGGFVRDPGGMVWGHPRGADAAITLQTGLEDFEVTRGTHVMFDCHGTLDMYCWDGGKTWVVGEDPDPEASRRLQAVGVVAEELLAAMRPGVRISELQRRGREFFRKAGNSEADSALIFFHGLGLSHMELEQTTADGQPNADWTLEEGMVVPLHLLYPGGATERAWLEEVVVVERDGGRALFDWGFSPIGA